MRQVLLQLRLERRLRHHQHVVRAREAGEGRRARALLHHHDATGLARRRVVQGTHAAPPGGHFPVVLYIVCLPSQVSQDGGHHAARLARASFVPNQKRMRRARLHHGVDGLLVRREAARAGSRATPLHGKTRRGILVRFAVGGAMHGDGPVRGRHPRQRFFGRRGGPLVVLQPLTIQCKRRGREHGPEEQTGAHAQLLARAHHPIRFFRFRILLVRSFSRRRLLFPRGQGRRSSRRRRGPRPRLDFLDLQEQRPDLAQDAPWPARGCGRRHAAGDVLVFQLISSIQGRL